MSFFSRTRASTPAKKKNDPEFAKQVASSATSSSTTRSPPRTARMRRPKASRICCRRPPAARCRRNSSHLDKALGDPERPVMAVVGGAKVSTKIALLENLVTQSRRARDRRRAWRTRSSPRKASRSANRSASAISSIPRAAISRGARTGCGITPAQPMSSSRRNSRRMRRTAPSDGRCARRRNDPRCRAGNH